MKFFFQIQSSAWRTLVRHYAGLLIPTALLVAALSASISQLMGVGVARDAVLSICVMVVCMSAASFAALSEVRGPWALLSHLRARSGSYFALIAICALPSVAFLVLRDITPSVEDAMRGNTGFLVFIPVVLISFMASLQIWMRYQARSLLLECEMDQQVKFLDPFSWITKTRKGLGAMTGPMFHFVLAVIVTFMIYDLRNLLLMLIPEAAIIPAYIILNLAIFPVLLLPFIAFFRSIIATTAADPRAFTDVCVCATSEVEKKQITDTRKT